MLTSPDLSPTPGWWTMWGDSSQSCQDQLRRYQSSSPNNQSGTRQSPLLPGARNRCWTLVKSIYYNHLIVNCLCNVDINLHLHKILMLVKYSKLKTVTLPRQRHSRQCIPGSALLPHMVTTILSKDCIQWISVDQAVWSSSRVLTLAVFTSHDLDTTPLLLSWSCSTVSCASVNTKIFEN